MSATSENTFQSVIQWGNDDGENINGIDLPIAHQFIPSQTSQINEQELV